jgi:hypothetical protein
MNKEPKIVPLGWEFITDVEPAFWSTFLEQGVFAPISLDLNICDRVEEGDPFRVRTYRRGFFATKEDAVHHLLNGPKRRGCVFHCSVVIEAPVGEPIATFISALRNEATFPIPADSVIGFDVVDEGFLSALMNIGGVQFLGDYREHLNGHGLFVTLESARRFAAQMESVDEAHSPLMVMQIGSTS